MLAGGWFVPREKYCWLVTDKPSEQGARPHMAAPRTIVYNNVQYTSGLRNGAVYWGRSKCSVGEMDAPINKPHHTEHTKPSPNSSLLPSPCPHKHPTVSSASAFASLRSRATTRAPQACNSTAAVTSSTTAQGRRCPPPPTLSLLLVFSALLHFTHQQLHLATETHTQLPPLFLWLSWRH
jgi:hypothetical protein